jgi:hypothetical protein
MIEWIRQNKEWLFSGAGISALGVLVWIVRTALNRQRREVVTQVPRGVPPKAEQIPATSHPEEPEPKESPLSLAGIIAEVYSRPPYQQKEAKRHYLGLKTEVSGILFSADPADDMISFTVRPKGGSTNPDIIFCNVHETECPELKVAHQGWHVRVAGILTDFDRFTAHLEQVKVLALEAEAKKETEGSDLHF